MNDTAATSIEVPTDAGAWSKFVDHYGVPLVLLLVLGWCMLSLAKFMRPYAERVMGLVIQNNEALPGALERMAASLDRVNEKLDAQNDLLRKIAEKSA